MQHKTEEEKADALTRWARGDDPQIIADELGVGLQTLKNWRAKAKEENFLANVHIGPKPSENVEGIVHQLQKHPNDMNSPEYKTGSVQVAACFELQGHQMTGMSGGTRKEFHFKYHEDLDQIAADYWQGKLEGSYWNFSNKVFEILAKSKR